MGQPQVIKLRYTLAMGAALFIGVLCSSWAGWIEGHERQPLNAILLYPFTVLAVYILGMFVYHMYAWGQKRR